MEINTLPPENKPISFLSLLNLAEGYIASCILEKFHVSTTLQAVSFCLPIMVAFYRHLFCISAYTILSRLTGFFRDIMLGAFLGGGGVADAFYIAFRLPNHFRAIFGEGAFNAAYVPSYTRILAQEGAEKAAHFSHQIFTLLLLSQSLLLVVAWMLMPQFLDLLAPGTSQDPEKYAYAIWLTRLTFPYLGLISLVTLYSARLNAHEHFSAAAFAPVLLNLIMIATLACSFLFPHAAVAASVGVTLSGIAQLICVMWAAARKGLYEHVVGIRLTPAVRPFFRALGPAVLGSAGIQIAMFADTILASLLPTGSISHLYYADRIYQLPIGIIGLAAGTVLLPEMSRRLAAGEMDHAAQVQNRTIALTLALTAPFCIAFAILPDIIMQGVFLRGNFTPATAFASAHVLFAYGFGLLPIVLVPSLRASFQARGDTRTPMICALFAILVNIILKIWLSPLLGVEGLAWGTSVGGWVNVGLLLVFSHQWGYFKPSFILGKMCLCVMVASLIMGGGLWLLLPSLTTWSQKVAFFPHELLLSVSVIVGIFLYSLPLVGMLLIRASSHDERNPKRPSI